MNKRAIALAASAAFAFGSVAALAQSTGGSPNDPNTEQNQQPAPGVNNPADPAAGSNPAARQPTAPKDSGSSGLDSGASGASAGSSGSAAEPNIEQNQQPAPGNAMPADPEAGSNPAARQPTAPQ